MWVVFGFIEENRCTNQVWLLLIILLLGYFFEGQLLLMQAVDVFSYSAPISIPITSRVVVLPIRASILLSVAVFRGVA